MAIETTATTNESKTTDFDLISLKIQEKIVKFRTEKQIALLESGVEKDITPEEQQALEQRLRQYALEILLKEKKKTRQERIEESGPLVRYYERFNNWYEELEKTPKGRIAKKFFSSGLTGSLVLGGATLAGLITPTTAFSQLGLRMTGATLFRGLAASAVKFLSKKKPEAIGRVASVFSKKNQSVTGASYFDSESSTQTSAPDFANENIDSTIGQLPEIDFKKLKYTSIALGTSFVFLLGGWVAAVATGVALVSKEQINEILKAKIAKCKKRIQELSKRINLDTSQDEFTANIKFLSKEIDTLSRTIEELETLRSVLKGAVTYANGFINAGVDLPGGGVVRRLATDPADEFKKKWKKNKHVTKSK